MKNAEVYLFGQVLGTHSFLLKDGFLQPDEYSEIKEQYFLPGGETGTAATVLDDFSADYVRQCVVEPMEQSIRSVEDNIAELRDTRSNRSEKCKKLERIQKDIQALISRIHESGE